MLQDLLSDSNEIGQLVKARSQRSSNTVLQLRRQAAALYAFLARQWPCVCASSHHARVYLRHKRLSGVKVSSQGSLLCTSLEMPSTMQGNRLVEELLLRALSIIRVKAE